MLSVLHKLGWFFRMYWKRYTIAIVLMIIAGIIDVIPPKLIGYAIDSTQTANLTNG